MPIPVAYLGVILIWSTTPLAIKWSAEGAGLLFAVTGRMVIGLAACLFLVALLRRRIGWQRPALQTYVAAAFGMWASMLCVYWGAQHIPSGLVSVIFGLTPLFTGWMAAVWLHERVFTLYRVLGMMLGIGGLLVIFARAPVLGPLALPGVAAVLASVALHAVSAVWVKRVNAQLHPLETTTGALIIVVPLYLLTWWLGGGTWPSHVPTRAVGAIVYLGLLGSVVGFVLYYYVLRHSLASRVALITLVTPVLALLIGHALNAEQVGLRVWFGAAMILSGLASYQWGDAWREGRLNARAAERAQRPSAIKPSGRLSGP